MGFFGTMARNCVQVCSFAMARWFCVVFYVDLARCVLLVCSSLLARYSAMGFSYSMACSTWMGCCDSSASFFLTVCSLAWLAGA